MMKTKLFLLTTAAALSCGFTQLCAQLDAPKPPPAPGEGGQGGPGGDAKTRFEEAFKKMDTNGDGKVSKEEYVEFSKKEAEDRFGKMDASGTGALTKDQMEEAFRKAMQARGQGGQGGMRRPDGQSGERPGGFRRPDGSGEGGSGTRQRPGADSPPSGGTPPPPPADGGGRPPGSGAPSAQGGPGGQAGGRGMSSGLGEMFRTIYEKGEITKDEFTKMSEEQFKKLDANGDGKVTKEELEEYGKKMREMRGGQGAPGGAPGGEGGFRRRPDGAGAAPKEGDRPKRPEGT